MADRERDAFEAWCADVHPEWNLHMDVWAITAWGAWQARAALSAPQHSHEAPQWVAVSERLPGENQTVAVLTREGDTLTAWATYWHGASTGFAQWTFPHDDDADSDVTHWAPLPQQPESGT
jgi:hypothetical protein